ncbi:hypothetical protein [Mycolicibacterium wolinskyi]|uniref:hypothetical protein n=1 Tax=Mycolicibacterium wolinskyi TaxID=59750 RepID=UPI0039179305
MSLLPDYGFERPTWPHENIDRNTDIDQYKEVLVSSFDLVNYAKDIAGEHEELFESMFEMIQDYQRTTFERLKGTG